jgi:hypothetical protein
MKVRIIIVWVRASSIFVKKGQPTGRRVSPQLTYEQVSELPILLYTSLEYALTA